MRRAALPAAAGAVGLRLRKVSCLGNDDEAIREAHERWSSEERKPNYVPPDASWPPPASRHGAEEIPSLRQQLERCGGTNASRCHHLGTALATALLGGVLFGHSATEEPADAASAVEGASLLSELMHHGCAEAACALGMCFMDGLGVELDESEAVVCYRRSAEAGYVHGQHALGCAYYLGEGTAADQASAAYWFERAALQGHPNACFLLGECLLDEGCSAARANALPWFMAAAERGHVGARARIRCEWLGMPLRSPVKPSLINVARSVGGSDSATVGEPRVHVGSEPLPDAYGGEWSPMRPEWVGLQVPHPAWDAYGGEHYLRPSFSGVPPSVAAGPNLRELAGRYFDWSRDDEQLSAGPTPLGNEEPWPWVWSQKPSIGAVVVVVGSDRAAADALARVCSSRDPLLTTVIAIGDEESLARHGVRGHT